MANTTDKTATGKGTSGARAESGPNLPKFPIRTTMPAELLRHDISDEELDMLDASKRDTLREAAWGFFGLGGGFVFSAARNIHATYISDKAVPLTGVDLIEVVACFAAFAIGITLAVICYRRSSVGGSLAARIRARTSSHSSGGASG